MSTAPQSAVSRQSTPKVGGSPTTETYGGENLPVLIQLPDLSEPVEPEMVPPPQRVEPEHEIEPVEDDGDTLRADRPESIRLAVLEPQERQSKPAPATGAESESLRERRIRQQQRQRRQRRQQRVARRGAQPASSWLRGIRQLALAAILAGVLLAVFVAFKGHHGTDRAETPEHADLVPLVDAPRLDVSGPPQESIADADRRQGPELAPPSLIGPEPTLEGMTSGGPTPVNGLQSPYGVQSGSTADHFGDPSSTEIARPATPTFTSNPAAATPYPTTGVEPVVAAPRGANPTTNRGWSETLPGNPVRSVERPTATPNHLHR